MTIELVLGLGNPGCRYAHTRHNVGFDVAAEVLRRRGPGEWTERPGYEIAVVTPGRFVAVARPLNFMNRSGGIAGDLLALLGIEPSRMLVVVDDIDLPLGLMRLRMRGGPGTHNGLRDMCDTVGTDYPRLRVGIRGATVEGDLADYVLGRFDEDEIERASAVIQRSADAVDSVLRDGVERSMNIFNRSPQGEMT